MQGGQWPPCGIRLLTKLCFSRLTRMSLRASPQTGVAIRIPFRTLMTQFPKKENGLPRRFAPRNDT